MGGNPLCFSFFAVGKWYLSASDFDVLDCEKVIFWRAVCDYYKVGRQPLTFQKPTQQGLCVVVLRLTG